MDATSLTAGEAAALLGVSRETLYAYVSRGLVTSEPGPGPSRARRYPRAPLEALRDRRERARDRDMAAHGALSWGLPVLDSALTLIRDGRCYYRGHDAVALAASESPERVAALLWAGDPDLAGEIFAGVGEGSRRPAAAPPSAAALARHLVDASETSLITLAAPDAVVWRGGARVVAGLFAAAGAVGGGPLAQRLARGWGTDAAPALAAALVLCADHELNVSAFTARCVASADASLEGVVLAALCALRGRRHGGLTERVEALVEDAARDGAARAADRALGGEGDLPGFGHPLYPRGDPRAAALLALAEGARPDPPGRRAAGARRRPARRRAHPRLRAGRAGARPGAAARRGGVPVRARPLRRLDRARPGDPRGGPHPAARPLHRPGAARGIIRPMSEERVRIDKWLWAARFFKTRSLATEAVQGGRVQIEGARVKPARDVRVGESVAIVLGQTTMTVVVRALADRRGSAAAAAVLYDETPESRERREREREQRRLAPPPGADLAGRPSKRDRRRIEAQRDRRPRRR